MTGITRRLAEFTAGIDFASLDVEVVERTRMLLMDQVGISIRGRNDAGLSASMSAALRHLGLGSGNASVIGDGAAYSPPAAALFNGNLGHSLDFDDTHASGSIHPSAPIVPAALAAAEMVGANGRTVVAAVVAGYEVQIRLSLALGPSDHYRQGFHPTPTCGVFGAASAAGRVLGLDASQMEDAFGLCGSLAAGSMQFLVDGAWNKPFHTGYAAMNGLIAACMAREGFRGAREAIEGRAGFLHAYAPNANPELADADLGERWETLRIAIKPYPSCRYSHAPVDALIALRDEHAIDWRDVESVEIGLSRTGWDIIGDPEEEKQRPTSYVDGQFSMPFCAAVAPARRDPHLGLVPHPRRQLRHPRSVPAGPHRRRRSGRGGLPRSDGRSGQGHDGRRDLRTIRTDPQGRARELPHSRGAEREVRRAGRPLHGREPARCARTSAARHRRGRRRRRDPAHDASGRAG